MLTVEPNSQSVVDTAQDVLTRVCKAMCQNPDLLEIEFLSSTGNSLVQLRAHPTDSRILVGKGGAHINALSNLARLLFHGSGRMVQIMPIETIPGHQEKPFHKFHPRKDWDQKKLLGLARTIVQAVFPDAKVSIEHKDEKMASRIIVNVEPEQNESAIKRLSSSLAVLFLPIGTQHGRMLYCSCQQSDQRP